MQFTILPPRTKEKIIVTKRIVGSDHSARVLARSKVLFREGLVSRGFSALSPKYAQSPTYLGGRGGIISEGFSFFLAQKGQWAQKGKRLATGNPESQCLIVQSIQALSGGDLCVQLWHVLVCRRNRSRRGVVYLEPLWCSQVWG